MKCARLAAVAALLLFAMLGPLVAAPRDEPSPVVASELTDEPYLYEIARHLYRWHLDEKDIGPELGRGEFVFWVRELHPELDPDDRSRFGEITLPRLGVTVRLKRADYAIPELDVTVKSETFKIVSVTRGPASDVKPAGVHEIRTPFAAMRDHLFRTRNLHRPPDDELLEQMRVVAREEITEFLAAREKTMPTGEQVVHLGPLSPVANEAWVFWETGRLLLRFSSDIDLAARAVWEHEEMAVDLYSVDEQVVVTLDEVAGSNAYMTRDHVGRVLFNCIVLGRRVVLPPGD